MNRRKAKKLHTGLYTQLGFELSGQFNPGTTNDQQDVAWGNLCSLADLLKLQFSGGWGPETFNFVFFDPRNHKSTTRDQAEAIAKFASIIDCIATYEVKNNVDLWKEVPEDK